MEPHHPPVDTTYSSKTAYKNTSEKKYYKFSGWNKSGEFNITSNTSISGSWDNGTSADEFTVVTYSGEEQYGKVVFGDCNGGIFVTIIPTYVGGTTGSKTCAYSKDGLTWNLTNASSSNHYWADIAYGDGYFVMIANDGYCSYSTDGVTWTEYSATSIKLGATVMCYGDNDKRFVATTGSYTIYCGSTAIANKSTWSGVDMPSNNTASAMCYGEGIYLVAINSSTDTYYQSTNGITWSLFTFKTSNGSSIVNPAPTRCSYLKDNNTGYSRFIFYNPSSTGYLLSGEISSSLTWTSNTGAIKFLDCCNTDTNPYLIMILTGSNVFRIGTVTVNSDDITYTTTPILYNGGVNYSNFTNVAYGNGITVITGATDNDKDNCYLFAVKGAFPAEYNYVS